MKGQTLRGCIGVLLVLTGPALCGAPGGPPPPGDIRTLEVRKVVTDAGGFVLPLPPGWTAREQAGRGARSVQISDPTGKYRAHYQCGASPEADILKLTGLLLRPLWRRAPDLALTEVRRDPQLSKMTAAGAYTDRRALKPET